MAARQQPEHGSSGSKRLRSASEEHSGLCAGAPDTLQAVLTTQQRNAAELIRHARRAGWSSLLRHFEQIFSRGIILTSHYSGMGSFEMVARQVFETIAVEMGVKVPEIISYSANESNKTCQEVLEKLQPPARPLHIFQDVLHHVPQSSRTSLLAIQSRCLEAHAKMKRDGASRSEAEGLAMSLLQELRAELCKLLLASQAPCLRHGQDCDLNPRRQYPHHFWIDASGVTCRPFSSIGSHDGWCHESTLPCLVWMYAMRFHEPQLVLHECVAQFPVIVLQTILNEPSLETHMKSLHSLPLTAWHPSVASENLDGGVDGELLDSPSCSLEAQPDADEDDIYSWMVQSEVFSPVDLGVPVARKRLYTASCLKRYASKRADLPSFKSLFRVLEPRVDLSIFLRLPGALVSSSVGLARHGFGSGDMLRKDGHLMAAAREGFCNQALDFQEGARCDIAATGRPKHCLAQLQHNASFQRMSESSTERIPTLTRNTHLWDLACDAAVNVELHWLFQGVPHKICEHFVHGWLVRDCPLKPVLRQTGSEIAGDESDELQDFEVPLSATQVRSITGNGMHWAQIGTWLLYAVSSMEVKE